MKEPRRLISLVIFAVIVLGVMAFWISKATGATRR
jgi:hypothetical protein